MRTKRMFDLLLLLPTAPIYITVTGVLALVVLAVDGGPVFFLQSRIGLHGRRFRIFKLRTMTLHEDVKQRVPTRLGGWLRARGLDELPQLFNVLLGDMSLVGPRPLTDDDATRLTALHAPFADRFQVPPGLTGLAQVCQARGATLTAQLDADYARRRSAWLDLRIIMRTAWINLVGKKRGARHIPSWNT